MLGQKTKHEVVSEFRSGEILRAARRVFAREGFDAATVDEIADAAGLAKGTVYVYFHSKRDLYLAALKQGMAALIEETRRSIDRAPTAAEKIRAFIAARIRFAEENRESIAMDYAEAGNTGHLFASGNSRTSTGSRPGRSKQCSSKPLWTVRSAWYARMRRRFSFSK